MCGAGHLLVWHVSGVRRSLIQTGLGISEWLSVRSADGEIWDAVLSPERGRQREHLSRYPQRQMVCAVRCADCPVINTESPRRWLLLLCIVLRWKRVSILEGFPRFLEPPCGSAVCVVYQNTIDPLRFLAGCRRRRLNHCLVVALGFFLVVR